MTGRGAGRTFPVVHHRTVEEHDRAVHRVVECSAQRAHLAPAHIERGAPGSKLALQSGSRRGFGATSWGQLSSSRCSSAVRPEVTESRHKAAHSLSSAIVLSTHCRHRHRYAEGQLTMSAGPFREDVVPKVKGA